MTVSALAVARSPLAAMREDYQPVSDAGFLVRRLWSEAFNFQRGSAADWTPMVEAALVDISMSSTAPGWDGEGSLPVTRETIALALEVAESLSALVPTGTPPPDILAESDGDISLTWSPDVEEIFAVSIGSHGKMNFAGQFGPGGSVHAWQPLRQNSQILLSESLQDVARYIRRLYPPTVTRRAA